MAKYKNEVEKLQLKKLRIEIAIQKKILNSTPEKPQEINSPYRKTLRFLKWFFTYVFPAALQLGAAFFAYIVIKKSNFFEASKIELSNREYELGKKGEQLKAINDSIDQKRNEYNIIEENNRNLTYANQKLDSSNKRFIVENTNLIKSRKTIIPFFLHSEMIGKHRIVEADQLILRMKENKQIENIMAQILRINLSKDIPPVERMLSNYILYNTNNLSSEKFINSIFEYIYLNYDTKLITYDTPGLLIRSKFSLEECIRIQRFCVEVIKENANTNSLLINSNNTVLINTAAYYSYIPDYDYKMYKSEPGLTIDFLSQSVNILKQDSVYKNERVTIHQAISLVCPPLNVIFGYVILHLASDEEMSRDELTKYQYIYGVNNVDPLTYSYGKILETTTMNIRETYYVDNPEKFNIWGYYIPDSILNRWMDSNLDYYRNNHKEFIDAIENEHL